MTEYGLILDLPSATDNDYVVGHPSSPYGVIGRFNKKSPVALEDRDLTLDEAKLFDKDPDCPLRLVKLPKAVINTTAANTADKGDDN